MEKEKAPIIICHRCSHIWRYRGEKMRYRKGRLEVDKWKKYATCPNCMTSVSLKSQALPPEKLTDEEIAELRNMEKEKRDTKLVGILKQRLEQEKKE